VKSSLKNLVQFQKQQRKKEIIQVPLLKIITQLIVTYPTQKNEYYKDRRLIGNHISPEELKKINFINEINPIWEVELKSSLSRFKVTEDDINITHLESLLQVENGERGRYIELVKVEFNNGKEFIASVDSATGKIIDSWDHPQRIRK
jgi:hypothetical protein